MKIKYKNYIINRQPSKRDKSITIYPIWSPDSKNIAIAGSIDSAKKMIDTDIKNRQNEHL